MAIPKERGFTISSRLKNGRRLLRGKNKLMICIAVCITAHLVPQCDAFFFPKSLFRKGAADESPPPPPPPQQHYQQQHPRILPPRGNNGNSNGGEFLQGSATDIQAALRIANRQPPPRNNDGPGPGSGFHVPKELCLACESFPWMPVAGGERSPATAASANIGFSQQTFHAGSQAQSPTKTIVINALGEAKGPVPIPPGFPSRRPFAIQFDGNQSGNKVTGSPKPNIEAIQPSSNQQINEVQTKPERPVTFQIFQAQTPNQGGEHYIQSSVEPIGMQPPPPPPPPKQAYGSPTILHPAASSSSVSHAPPSIVGLHASNQQGSLPPPPNPLAVGTIVATQQNNAVLPEFQKIEPAKLVYQEHYTSQYPAPPSPQNFKVPIISQAQSQSNSQPPQPDNGYSSNSIANSPPIPPQQNYGPPPQSQYRPIPGFFMQMRPPAPYKVQPPPSPNMKPPGVMIHYGKPIRIPHNVGQQRPSGQVHFPPPQAFLQMAPPPPPPLLQQQPAQQQTNQYGPPRPENNLLDSGSKPQEERRPAPSGQVLNILQPQNVPVKVQGLNTNSIQPVPIPVPTPQNSNQVSNGQARPAFTQETGWEIIPSIQTDLTHLFASEQGRQQQRPQAGNELPVPVPIPVPQTHPPKAPIFIVAGADQQLQNQQQNTQIKVQDVTYHEESRNPVPSDSLAVNSVRPGPPAKLQQLQYINAQNNDGNRQVYQQQEQNQQILQQGVRQPENEQIQSQQHQENHQQQHPIPQQVPIIHQPIIRPRPFILGVPTAPGPRPVIFRPRPQQGYEPLHPSIMTALKHAQHTSLLTHQYLSQSNLGQVVRDNSIYVSPVPPTAASSNALTTGESADQTQLYQGIDPRIPIVRPTVLTDQSQTNVNCQNTNQHFIPIQTHQKLQLENTVDFNTNQHQTENEEEASNLNQSSSSSSADSPSENDNPDQSLSSGADRENFSEDDASPTAESSLNSLKPEPTATTSFQSSSTSAVSTSPGIRGSINVEDNGNKGSYMIYYPRAVSKSPVYWVQPSRTLSQGVVRLSPQITPTSPSVASTVVTWSRPRVVVANQFRTEPYQPEPTPTQEGRAEEASYEREESGESSGNVEEHAEPGQASDLDPDEQIPYGQKLGVSRDNGNGQTPYDIISVSGSDDDAQSLESDSTVDHASQGIESAEQEGKEPLTGPEFSSTGNDVVSTDNNDSNQETVETPTGSYGEYLKSEDEKKVVENEDNLQDVHEPHTSSHDETDDADDERDDFGFRPQTIFRKPISTTVIHSPGASSFQSLKLPNFKPHRVIVHDFTTHSANAAATGPSESQGNLESSESQEAPASESVPDSWKASQKLKAPKLVESERGRDEDSSESVQRPQGFNIQEVIASGPVSTADCLTTAHNGHLLSSHSSTSPRTAESSRVTSGKGRDIYLPLGSRFPGGRPSIFSAVRRPITTMATTNPTSSSTSPPPSTIFTSSEREPAESLFQPNDNKRDRYLGQSPSGFAASIPVPVYRRPVLNHGSKDSFNSEETRAVGIDSSVTTRYIRPQTNIILSTEDIYKTSEVKESNRIEDGNESIKSVESSTLASSPLLSVESETIDSADEIMSTEKSSSFSVSVVDDKGGSSSVNEDERAGSVGRNELQQVNERPSSKLNIVHVTSVPVVGNDVDPITTSPSVADNIVTSTTAIPLPASTSTKIVKTVRVRQRMRSGSFNGPLRTRFHGGGKVRVVHRPANQEYIRHFPEFSTQEGDKLGKEEEQEVKNALIELKKSPESIKTH